MERRRSWWLASAAISASRRYKLWETSAEAGRAFRLWFCQPGRKPCRSNGRWTPDSQSATKKKFLIRRFEDDAISLDPTEFSWKLSPWRCLEAAAPSRDMCNDAMDPATVPPPSVAWSSPCRTEAHRLGLSDSICPSAALRSPRCTSKSPRKRCWWAANTCQRASSPTFAES